MHKLIYVLLLVAVVNTSRLVDAAENVGYQYDDLHRLTMVSRSDGTSVEYRYDEAGNRTKKIVTVSSTADLIIPVVGTFSGPATSSSLIVSGINLAATDNVSVTGYLINESSTKPLPSDAGWVFPAPTGYSFTTAGSKTLYAWAKDAAGNVSNVYTPVTISITLADSTAPTISAFTIPAISSSLTVNGIAIVASDDVAVTGYKLTESSTKPSAGDSGWFVTVPTSYLFASEGTKTLYAWAKDASGNVSNAFTPSTVTISTPESILPVVTAFTLPATSTSLTVTGISLSATDNVAVTGYLLTESSTKPLAGNTGWSASSPASYVFTSAGAKTLYAWAKDASGNVSDYATGNTTVTLSTNILFQDDFNDNVIDSTKWVVTRGNARVAEESGVMKVEQNVTDAGGYLQSMLIPIEKNVSLTIKRKVLVHSGGEYTYHNLGVYLNTDATPVFAISYLNTLYYDGGYQGAALNGIYTTSAAGVRTKLNDAIWDTWFDEEIVYDPTSGQLNYKINNATVNSVNVGLLPVAATNNILLGISPYGWWTGHYHYMDDISVSQASANAVCGTANNSTFHAIPTTNLCAVGSASSVTGTGPWNWACTTSGGSSANCSALYAPGVAAVSSDIPKIINDNSSINSTVQVAQDACSAITDVNVSADITHTYVGDLVVTLSHSTSGKSVTLFNNSCSNNANLAATFDDEAASVVQCPPNGAYKPAVSLNAFDGIDAAGIWTLSVSDTASGDVGTLNSWGLSLSCSALPPVNGTCGSSSGTALVTAPTENLCLNGTSSTVTGSGPWSWTCNGTNGGTNASCSAEVKKFNVTPVVGAGVTLTPSTVQSVLSDATVTFRIFPPYGMTAVTGTCGGTFTMGDLGIGDKYVTNPITSDCTVVVNMKDTMPPALSVSTLVSGSLTNNATLNIAGIVSDASGVKSVTVNGQAVTVANDGTFSTALTLTAGQNTVSTVATDNQSNSTNDVRSVTLDVTVPELTVSMPVDNSVTGQGSMTVSGTVSETAVVKARVGTGTWQTAQMNGTAYSIIMQLAAGQNTIEISATDSAGNNVATTGKRTVTYDNSNPSLAVSVPNQDITTASSGLVLTGTAGDLLSKVSVTVNHYGQDYTPIVTSGAFSQSLSFDTAKTYPVAVTAKDEANNSTTVIRNIIFAPYTVNISASTGGSISGNANQVVSEGSSTSTVTAIPNSSYQFVNWTGTGGFTTTSANPLSVGPVTSGMTISANFTSGAVNGVCGSSNGAVFTTAPTANLCVAGSSSAVTGIGPWNWTCVGSNGGSNTNCSTQTSSSLPGHSGIVVTAPSKTSPDISDALKVLQHISENKILAPSEIVNADVAPLGVDGKPLGNGDLDIADVIMILRRVIGIGNW